jgi:protocatechuate 3,4-dioxygenase beta subunit
MAPPDPRRQRVPRYLMVLGVLLAILIGGFTWYLFQAQADVEGATPDTARAAVETPSPETPLAPASEPPARTSLEVAPPEPPAEEAKREDPPANELRGRVVDLSGAPIAGADVSLHRGEARGFSVLDLDVSRATQLMANTTSDARGEFRFVLERGVPVDLRVEAGGFCPAVIPDRHAGEFVEVKLFAGYLAFGRITREADGAPIADARVRVFRLGGTFALSRETRTGGDGRYEIRFTFSEGAILEVVPGIEQASDWIPLIVSPEGTVETNLALPDGLVVTGKVTDRSSGSPIAGATVGEGWVFRKKAQTDANGEYRLTGFGNAGVGDLHVKARGFGKGQQSELPGAVEGMLRVDFALTPARSASGRVVDGDGAPIPGVLAAAVASEMGAQGQRTDWLAARTDAAGRFYFDDLTHDLRHALLLTKPGHGSRVYDFPSDELGSPDLDLGTLVLGKPAVLAGTVEDGAGGAVVNVDVILKGHNSDRFKFREGPHAAAGSSGDWYVDSRSTRSDDRGRFSFGDLSAGSYSLHARERGRPESAKIEVEIGDGEVREGVRIPFSAGASLRGRLLDPERRAIGRAYVSAHPVNVRDPKVGWQQVTAVQTDEEGKFQFLGLAAGEYRIDANVWSMSAPETHGALLPGRLERVSTDQAGELEIVLERGATIEGSLVDAQGAALFHHTVIARGPGGESHSTSTDAQGAFTLVVAPGTVWELEVRGIFQTEQWQKVLLTQPGVAAGSRGLELRLP